MTRDAIVETLRQALRDKPGLGPAQLKQRFGKVDAAAAREIALELAARGELHRLVKGKTERFFETDPIARLDQVVPELVRERPLTAPALKQQVERVAPGHGALVAEWLKNALARRVIFERASKPKSYAAEPDLGLLLKKPIAELRKVLPKLDDLGVPRARVAALLGVLLGASNGAPAPEPAPARERDSDPDVDRRAVLAALTGLASEYPEGALLAVRELRSRAGIGKDRFDRAALALAGEGRITLHHHDYPGALSDAERSAFIRDEHGNYYMGVAPRRPS